MIIAIGYSARSHVRTHWRLSRNEKNDFDKFLYKNKFMGLEATKSKTKIGANTNANSMYEETNRPIEYKT